MRDVGLLIDGDIVATEVAPQLVAGTVFVNAHGLSAIDVDAPMGGWKQSGSGFELGTEGMQAFARQRVRVVRPGPSEHSEQSDSDQSEQEESI